MNHLVKDSGLNNLKASVQRCDECAKPQVHYSAVAGCPVCHVCGYSPVLAQLADDEMPVRQARLRIVGRAA